MARNFRNKNFSHRNQSNNRNPRNHHGNHQNHGNGSQQQKVQWQTQERLSEAEVGVTQFMSKDSLPFTAIIKARYSDFHVNEVALDGTEAVLSDFKCPKHESEAAKEESVEDTTNLDVLRTLITEEQIEHIQKLVNGTTQELVLIDVTDFDKEKRTSLHKALNEAYGKSIVNNTLTDRDDNKKIVQVKKFSKHDKKRAMGWLWPAEYTYFIMFKENIDTLQAITALSSQLKIKPAMLTYAGTKDKRAKTSQWISARKIEPSKIIQAAKKCQGVKVGNFGFKADTLKLGQLKGNRFRIALKSIAGASEETIGKAVENLRDFGFINYYGMQRFGNCAKIPTHEVGRAILRSDYKLACDLILQERDGEPPYMQKMRKIWAETKNAREALKVLHISNTSVEARLLKGMARTEETNYLQALMNIPRNMLQLYAHAYQSLIWNQVASKRMEMGLQLIEGDLVYTEIAVTEEAEKGHEVAETESEETPAESKFLTMVRPLTAEDIASGKFTIFDIVMPLPGHDVRYPIYEDIYLELLGKDDLTSEKLKSKHNIFSLTGAYRKVFGKPENVSWKLMKYTDQSENLILSDYEKIMNDAEPVENADGTQTALLLDFVLQPSSYATMAIRELMKCDTSKQVQMDIDMKNQTAETSEKRAAEEEVTEIEAKKQKTE